MITKPPPYDSAPTLNATQATASRPPDASSALPASRLDLAVGAARASGMVTADRTGPGRSGRPAAGSLPDPACGPCRARGQRAASSTNPHAASSSTMNAPARTPANPPATRYMTQRQRALPAPARRQLAGIRLTAAARATAGTTAPAPAAAPAIHAGG